MNEYQVKITSRAQKNFKRLHQPVQKRIIRAIRSSKTERFPQQFKQLKGDDVAMYRIRVGDYRILYDGDDDRRTVLVLRIGHWKDMYR